jgi:hypothetical protein
MNCIKVASFKYTKTETNILADPTVLPSARNPGAGAYSPEKKPLQIAP